MVEGHGRMLNKIADLLSPRVYSQNRSMVVRMLPICALVLAAGCGGFFVYPGSTSTGSTSTTGDYIYVANATTSNLAGFSVSNGALTAVTGSPYTLSISPATLAINPANTILYVAGGASIYAYAIQSTGALSVLNSGSPVATASVVSMDISPDGQWLLALDASGAAVDEYKINSSTGALTAQTFPFSVSGAVAHAIRIAPSGLFVFAALGTGGDLAFPFTTATGALASPTLLSEAAGQSDDALAVDPTSTYLYIGRSGTNGGLAVYAINGGALSAVTGSPFAASNQPAAEKSVVLNKAGTDVYVANYNDGTISGFSIGSGGVPAALAGSPFTAGSGVTAMAIDNSGSYLLAAAQGGTPDLALYAFDSVTAGKLDLSASTTTGTDPTGAIAIAATH
jgi:6-phosphogluconolactonase (cycloisomerase 2 family)